MEFSRKNSSSSSFKQLSKTSVESILPSQSENIGPLVNPRVIFESMICTIQPDTPITEDVTFAVGSK